MSEKKIGKKAMIGIKKKLALLITITGKGSLEKGRDRLGLYSI
jgi:hypothetical protein